MHRVAVLVFLLLTTALASSCSTGSKENSILVGAEQPEKFQHLLKEKQIGLMVNHTSRVDSLHLVDFLLEKKLFVKTIFAIEHGFRGEAANGEVFQDSVDAKTGIPIVSLYGQKKKPGPTDLEGLDIVIFDIQDVGCRFYTYISSLYYLMDACAENDVPLLILDRPNPNGDYIAGPVLDMKLQSFVGMLPIPVVHGCTVGELARMINGEHWLTSDKTCNLTVIPVANYTHSMRYSLPIAPSPNLPNDVSVRLYPSLCFFEATNVSIGRGTDFPFQVIGYPNSPTGKFQFQPRNIPGKSTNPIHLNKTCNGIDLRELHDPPLFTLSYFLQFYTSFNQKDGFWKSERWINLLSGDPDFYTMVNDNKSALEIEASWKADLEVYSTIRTNYLMYPDFE